MGYFQMARNIEELFGGIVEAPHQIPYTYTSTIGGETFISLPFTPVSGVVTINGSVQVPLDNFVLDGNTLNLGRELEIDDVVYCLFDKILSPQDTQTSIRIYKFKSVGGETTFTPDFTAFGVQTLYIDGKYQVPGVDYIYSSKTGVVSLTTPLAPAVWVSAEMTVKQSNSSLSGDDGASKIGTASGNTVQEELDNNLLNDREQWRRTLAEAGLTLVDGSFEEGATVSSKNDAVWYIAGGQCYTWGGTGTKTVPSESTPISTGGIGDSKWLSTGSDTLRSDLAATDGVGLVNGAAKQADVDSLNIKTASYVTPEQFSSLVTDGDWTAALNAALATGKPVLTSNVTYATSGQINSVGNKFLGRGKIQCTQFPVLPSANMSVSEPDTASVRMMYLATCSNLAEYLVIKQLGFNEIDWHPHTNTDALQVLDNALTAGLRVRLTTSDIPNDGIAAFVAVVDSHPALVGYSVIDEPATRGFSVEDQNARIDLFRAVTAKELSMVDLAVSASAAFDLLWSQNYDLVFVDAYSLYYPTGDRAQWLKDDLHKFRFDFGTIMAQTKCDRVIPMMSAYAETVGQANPFYSQDVDQVVAASSVFGKVGKGNFAAFVWDYPFDGGVRTVRSNAKLLKLCVDTAAQPVRKEVVFKPYIFGCTGNNKFWDLQELINSIPVADKASTDPYVQQSAYPVRVKSGASNTDRITTSPGIDFAGIGFKGSVGALQTGIKAQKHVCLRMEYFAIDNGLSSTFSVLGSEDGGYTVSADMYNAGVTPGTVINANITTYDFGTQFPDKALCFRISTNGDTGTLYRKFLRGILICSDW